MIDKYWWVMDYYNRLHTYTFGWCDGGRCRAPEEHEWKYDGQVFYKVKPDGN